MIKQFLSILCSIILGVIALVYSTSTTAFLSPLGFAVEGIHYATIDACVADGHTQKRCEAALHAALKASR